LTLLQIALDKLIEKTYTALLSVVKTTAVSKKVLARPPFTFLHKLLVETLGEYGIFTEQQLLFSELAEKDDKAAFLTRALGFVTYTLNNAKDRRVSCLLSVSPVQVLAGLAVEQTLEFLLQLCDVCNLDYPEAKAAAAQEVLKKGDASLYTKGVKFRKGILTMQILVRALVKRRRARRQKQDATNGSSASNSESSSLIPSISAANATVGLKFLKAFQEFGIYEGVIKEIKCGSGNGPPNSRISNSNSDKIYLLYYPQDEDEEEVNEKELQEILDESQRLLRLRSQVTSSSTTVLENAPTETLTALQTVDNYRLNGLPDLSSPIIEQLLPSNPLATAAPFSKEQDSGNNNTRDESKRQSLIDPVTQKTHSSSFDDNDTSTTITAEEKLNSSRGETNNRPTTSGERLPVSNQSRKGSSSMGELPRPRSGRDLEPIVRQIHANSSSDHSNIKEELAIKVAPMGSSTDTIKPWQAILRNAMVAKTGGDQSNTNAIPIPNRNNVIGSRSGSSAFLATPTLTA
jgi:hypothetical protein